MKNQGPGCCRGSRDGALLWADIYNQRLTSVITPWGALSLVITVRLKHICIISAVDSMTVSWTVSLCLCLRWLSLHALRDNRFLRFWYLIREHKATLCTPRVWLESPQWRRDALACWYAWEMRENESGNNHSLVPLLFSKYQKVTVISQSSPRTNEVRRRKVDICGATAG